MYDVLPSPIVIFGLPILVLYAVGIKVHVVFKPEVWQRWLSTPAGEVGSFECAPGCDGRRHLQDIGGDAMMLVSRIAERALGCESTLLGKSLTEYRQFAKCQPGSSSDLEDANAERATLGWLLAVGGLAVLGLSFAVVETAFSIKPENPVRLTIFGVLCLIPMSGTGLMMTGVFRYIVCHYGWHRLDFYIRQGQRLSTAPRGVLYRICKPSRWDVFPVVLIAVALVALSIAAGTAMLNLW